MTSFSSTLKKTLRTSTPLVTSRLVSALSGFLSMILIAMLGRTALAAGALISSSQITINATAWSILFSLSAIVSRAFGEGKRKELGHILRQGWLLSCLISILMMILFWSMGAILTAFHQDPHLVQIVAPYFRILVWGCPAGILYICTIQFMAGVSRAKYIVHFSLITILLSLAPGYGLLFGKFGLPNLGIIGMAYASVLAMWTGLTLSIFHLIIDDYYKPFDIFNFKVKQDFSYLHKIFSVGFPIAVQFASELSAFSFSIIMIGWLGETPLAAQQIIIQLSCLVIMVPSGIGQASGILIGQALGQKNFSEIRLFGKAGLYAGLIFITGVAVVYWGFPRLLIRLFSLNPDNAATAQIVHTTVILLAIDVFVQCFDAIRNITTGALRGFHDTKMPMINGIIASWGIAIPLGYILCFPLHIGIIGIRIATAIAWLFGSITLLHRFHNKSRLAPSLIQHNRHAVR